MDTSTIASNGLVPQQLGDFLATRTAGKHSSTAKPSPAIEHLRWLDPDGWHNLVALDPAGQLPPDGKTFAPDQWAEISRWIEQREGRQNLYFAVNEPRPSSPDKKLTDADIGKIRCICADVDPSRDRDLVTERERIRALAESLSHGTVTPTVVDSGGGYQFFWRLPEKLDPVANGSAARAQGRGIARAIGGDAVHDLARVMRLPGTTNIPDAKKAARGRTRTMAKTIVVSDGSYSLGDLGKAYPPAAVASASDKDVEIEKVRKSLDMHAVRASIGLADLDDAVRRRFEALLATDEHARKLWAGDASVLGKDKSGSAYRGALAGMLGRAGGFTPQHFGEILHAWEHAVTSGEDLDEVIDDRLIARDWVRVGLRLSPERWLQPIDQEASQPQRPEPPQWSMVSAQDASRDALNDRVAPLVKGLLDVGALSILYGDSNTGKTFVAMDIGFHIATGLPWGGMRTTRSAVLYVAAEGGAAAGKRCRALREKLGAAFDSADFSLHRESVDLLRASADLQPLIAAVKAAKAPIGLIVIDTLSRALAGGDENASTDMGALVKNIDQIRKHTGAHVMAVHHSGKDKARGARGHSLLRAATDTEIEIAENQILVTKQRDLDKSFSSAFALETVVLGQDVDGDSITSCVVRLATTIDAPPAPPTATEQVVLDALTAVLSAMPDDIRTVATRDIVDFLAAAGTAKDSGSVRTFLKRLAEKGHVRAHGRGRWELKIACRALLDPVVRATKGVGASATSALNARRDLFA